MSGPSTSRPNVNTAPLQGLTNPLQNLLQGFLQSGQNPFAQPSDLQRQTTAAFGQLNAAGNPGQQVIDAAQSVFQRNLQLGADTLRQAGPRFNSNTERLVGLQGQNAMQDFNQFSAGVLQQGQSQQLQNLMGAGSFANQMQGQNNDILSQLLGMSGQLGAGPAALQQHAGGFANMMKVIGTAGALAAALPTGGASLAALPMTTGMTQNGAGRSSANLTTRSLLG